jgi:hypothetical protein
MAESRIYDGLTTEVYGSVAKLVSEIQQFIYRHVDLSGQNGGWGIELEPHDMPSD